MRVLPILLLSFALTAQAPWTQEELEEHLSGFLQGSTSKSLAQIADILAHKDRAFLAVMSRIHGNHAEYLLEVRRLVAQLTDERWKKREEAERSLIEVGARARSLIETHAASGVTLEERQRCGRILERLSARGTEKEDREAKQMRWLVVAAPYFGNDEKVRDALRSARGHSDAVVAENALRALGAIGGDAEADVLHQAITHDNPERRAAALAALGRVASPRALVHLTELCAKDKLTTVEKIALVRDLRGRAGAEALLASLAATKDEFVQAAVKVALLPAPAPAAPVMVKLVLSDQSQVGGKFLGLVGDSVKLGNPVEGLASAEIPLRAISSLEFKPLGKATETRVFLTRGGLVCGKLLGLDAGTLILESRLFGELRLARSEVQGLALDPKLDRLLGASAKLDKLRMKDNRLVEGSLDSLADGQLVLRKDGQPTSIPLADAAGILFRRASPQTDTQRFTRVELTSGDRLLGHIATVDASHLALVVPGLGAAVIQCSEIARIEADVAGGAIWGFTLIADYSDNCVVEVDEQGKEVFRLENVLGAWDAECLDSGNLLVTEFAAGVVKEMTRASEVVWSFTDLKNPYCARRLANGNTLIADTFANRVIEIDQSTKLADGSLSGKVVWTFDKGIKPADCERLPNGNTLIADMSKDRVIEVTPAGDVTWEVRNLLGIYDCDRLQNGNTLVTLRTLNKVVEIDREGKTVWTLANLNSPSDADRLPNGNTLVAENGGVREFDRAGNVVWKKPMSWAVEVNRY